MPKKSFTRGRKPKRFSLLAKSFRNPITKIICKSKPFSDDKSRCFVRKLIKDPLFLDDINPVNERLKVEMQRLGVKTANKKADMLIEMMKETEGLVASLYQKFVAQVDWDAKLEMYLNLEWCGPGSKLIGFKALLDCIFGYIGPKNQSSKMKEIDENDEYDFCLDSRHMMADERIMELENSLEMIGGGVLEQKIYGGLLRIDLIEPKLPKREKENNRQLHDPDDDQRRLNFDNEDDDLATDYCSNSDEESE